MSILPQTLPVPYGSSGLCSVFTQAYTHPRPRDWHYSHLPTPTACKGLREAFWESPSPSKGV